MNHQCGPQCTPCGSDVWADVCARLLTVMERELANGIALPCPRYEHEATIYRKTLGQLSALATHEMHDVARWHGGFRADELLQWRIDMRAREPLLVTRMIYAVAIDGDGRVHDLWMLAQMGAR